MDEGYNVWTSLWSGDGVNGVDGACLRTLTARVVQRAGRRENGLRAFMLGHVTGEGGDLDRRRSTSATAKDACHDVPWAEQSYAERSATEPSGSKIQTGARGRIYVCHCRRPPRSLVTNVCSSCSGTRPAQPSSRPLHYRGLCLTHLCMRRVQRRYP